MTSSTVAKQATLPGIEQAICGCGCNQYFMRSTRGRKRIYINATHKKRALRAREKAARVNSGVTLQPVGWLFLATHDADTAKHLWEQMSAQNQAVLKFLCDTGLSGDEIRQSLKELFGLRKPK